MIETTFTIYDDLPSVGDGDAFGGKLTDSMQRDVDKITGMDITNELKKLREESGMDKMTGIPNWVSEKAQSLAAQKVADATRAEQGLIVGMIDLDHLHSIDQLGQQVGDTVIKTLVKACQNTFRESDLVFRAGGDEFYIILTEMFPEDLKNLMKRLGIEFASLLEQEEFEGRVPAVVSSHSTFTAGLSYIPQSYNIKLDDVDAALVRAGEQKNIGKTSEGRNAVYIENGDTQEKIPLRDIVDNRTLPQAAGLLGR